MNEFLTKFIDLFDDTDPTEIQMNTRFRDLDEWSSLLGLSVILMADEEYGVTIGATDIKSALTVEDLYNVILSKK